MSYLFRGWGSNSRFACCGSNFTCKRVGRLQDSCLMEFGFIEKASAQDVYLQLLRDNRL